MQNAAHHKVPLVSLLLALTCLLIGLLPSSIADKLALTRQAILRGEWWGLWTGHMVHFSSRQLIVDGSVLLILGAWFEAEYGHRALASLLVFAMPALSLFMLLDVPRLVEYRGASGICMVLVPIVGISMWRALPELRKIIGAFLVVLILKTLLEAMGAAPDVSGLEAEIRVVWQAHIVGAAIGMWWFAVDHRKKTVATAYPQR